MWILAPTYHAENQEAVAKAPELALNAHSCKS